MGEIEVKSLRSANSRQERAVRVARRPGLGRRSEGVECHGVCAVSSKQVAEAPVYGGVLGCVGDRAFGGDARAAGVGGAGVEVGGGLGGRWQVSGCGSESEAVGRRWLRWIRSTCLPVITPSYTPVPLVSAPTATGVPVPAPDQDADALSYTPRSPEQISLVACAVVSRREDSADARARCEPSLVSAGVVFAETVTAPSKPSDATDLPVACRFAEPEPVHVEIVAAHAAGEEPATQEVQPGLNNERIAAQRQSTPPQGRGRARPRHRPNKKPRGGKGQDDHFRVQDRYGDDRQETNGRTTLRDTGSVRAQSPATGRERYLEHLRLKSRATMLVSGDGSPSAAKSSRRAAAELAPVGQVNQLTSVSEKCSEGSDPLTADEQTIKKPVLSTSGDRP